MPSGHSRAARLREGPVPRFSRISPCPVSVSKREATPGLPRLAAHPAAVAGDRLDPAPRVAARCWSSPGFPLLLYGVSRSLASPEAYAALKASFSHPLAKLVLIALLWSYLHHFCAGIRYLLLDIHRGIELEPARRSSAVVMVLSLALTLILGARLW